MEKLQNLTIVKLASKYNQFLWGLLGAFIFFIAGFIGFNTFDFEGKQNTIFEFYRLGQTPYIIPPGTSVVENSLQFYLALSLIMLLVIVFFGIFVMIADGKNQLNKFEKSEMSWRKYHLK